MLDAANAKRDSAAGVSTAGIVARAVLALAVLGGIPRFVQGQQAQLSDVPPTAAAQIAPTIMPIQGLKPALIKRSVETYPPMPESAEWPSESWPV